MLWLAPPLLLAAGTALAADADVAARARALDREASQLSAMVVSEDERFAEESAGDAAAAAMLSDYAELDARTKRIVDQVLARAEAHRKATLPLRVRAALLADELQRYRDTGALTAPTPAEVAKLTRFLDAPWQRRSPDVAPFSQDLLVMQKQLRKWDAAAPKPVLVARRARPRREPLSTKSTRVDSGGQFPRTAAPIFMTDAGLGRAKSDPVPALLAQLGSGGPRLRALAAEELGQQRDARAVDALRRALSDASPEVRASAALALGQIGDASRLVIEDLKKALDDPSEEVRVDTRTALSFLVRR